MSFILRFFVLALIMVGGSAASCSAPSESKEMVNSAPDFVGFVTAIDRGGTDEVIGRITIESHANKLVDRHFVTIMKSTALLRREGTTFIPVDLNALKQKDWVQLWFSGAVSKPYAPELTARRLVIVDRP